jgi:YHS domain-containing protein
VCGMTVDTSDPAHAAMHDGTTYYFCCAGCEERFLASPAQFASTPAR